MKGKLAGLIVVILLVGTAVELRASSVNGSYTNSMGMGFVQIPAGTFVMGSPESERGRDGDERQHKVVLTKSFYLQTTEVTQGQWQKVMGENSSVFQDCGADCPVERVSWYEAQTFVKKLSEMTGQKYRLPTEAEFEYAARAGSSAAFANGDITETSCSKDPILDAMGWYCFNSDEKTHPVALKQANAWGLFDLHGNVWEWCEDSRGSGDYPAETISDPLSVNPGGDRVIRGGSWYHEAWFTRSGNRDWSKPHYRNEFVGFRVVLEKI